MSEAVKKPKDIRGVYYITALENIPSILRHGVLSHAEARERGVEARTIYDAHVVAKRGEMRAPDGGSLWNFANFYFNARNPMLYRVVRGEGRDVAVLFMRRDLMKSAKYVSVGNAAHSLSAILPFREGVARIQRDTVWEKVQAEVWREDGEARRLTMSELLVPGAADAGLIQTIYVPTAEKAEAVRKMLSRRGPGLDAVPHPDMFFRAIREISLRGTRIRIVDGDMFFSDMQTLTVSVNTRGAMGGGLASRAKHAFPDVYVDYQEACREGRLTVSRPCLFKREGSLDRQYAEDPSSLPVKPNANRWFLLFATKEHWKYPSRAEYIEGGLKWLVENAKGEGITSLALPSLGCGLGGLRWEDAGPLMCRYLRRLDIPCEIYLPREGGKIPDAQLSEKFLLDENSGVA